MSLKEIKTHTGTLRRTAKDLGLYEEELKAFKAKREGLSEPSDIKMLDIQISETEGCIKMSKSALLKYRETLETLLKNFALENEKDAEFIEAANKQLETSKPLVTA